MYNLLYAIQVVYLARIFVLLELFVLISLIPFFWFPCPLTEWTIFLIPLFWIIRRLITGQWTARTFLNVPIAVFLVIIPFSLLVVVDWKIAQIKLYALVLGIAIAFSLANAISNRARLVVLGSLVVIVFGGGTASIGLVGTEWQADKQILPFAVFYDRLPRLVHGIVPTMPRGGIHPNEIAGMLILLLPLGLILCYLTSPFVRGEKVESLMMSRMNKYWMISIISSIMWLMIMFSTFLMVIVLLLTQSRSGYVGLTTGLFGALGLYVVRSSSTMHGRTVRVGACLISGATFSFVMWRVLQSWFVGSQASGLDTFPSRLELWRRSIMMLQDFPFTGIGPGQFPIVLSTLYPPLSVPSETYVPHAHNFILQIGLDFGIPGATTIVFLLVAFLTEIWTASQPDRPPLIREFALGLGGGLGGFLAYGLTDALALGARGALLLWIVLGLGAGLQRVRTGNHPRLVE